MRNILFGIAMMAVWASASAQENYAIGLIPKDMLPYASAVIREQDETVELKDLDNVTYHVRKVVTILNANGDGQAALQVDYDKSTSIKMIRGLIYDEYGKIQQKIAEKDFEDVATSDGFSLFQDSRAKRYTKAVTQYPYTIEFEYEIREKQSFGFGGWKPSPDEDVSVVKSSYTFICKPDYKLRYKAIRLAQSPTMGTTKEGMTSYAWQVSSLKAHRYEPLNPGWQNIEEVLYVAPTNFKYGPYSGSFSDWQQLGKWEYDNLLKDRQTLSYETVQYVKSITANIEDPKLKAKKLYEYMQQKTHYINIIVGIGGLQPFPASDVDKDGYGDCKALVNYTRALLQAAGIDSYYCQVYGNVDKIDFVRDFPSVQGNHIILCIPFKNDTTWLECTNQHLPFGYLGDFTDDRTVLACTPDGGKLLHTPKYTTDQNLITRRADFTFNDNGDLQGTMNTVFEGTCYENREGIIEKARADWSKDFKRYYPINNIYIKKLEYTQDKGIAPATTEDVAFTAYQYGATSDSKFYFQLNSFDEVSALKQVRNRTEPVTIMRGLTYEDNITYVLPKGYQVDSEPLNVSLDKAFGSFKAVITVKDGQLTYTRKLQIKDGTYDKDMYQDVVDFYDAVREADDYKVILAKK